MLPAAAGPSGVSPAREPARLRSALAEVEAAAAVPAGGAAVIDLGHFDRPDLSATADAAARAPADASGSSAPSTQRSWEAVVAGVRSIAEPVANWLSGQSEPSEEPTARPPPDQGLVTQVL